MSSLLSPTPILQLLTICFLSLLCAVSAQAEGGTIIPRSEISKEAYQRLEPQLEEEMQKKNMHLGQPIFMRIFKEEKELEVWVKKDFTYELFKTYTICTFSGKLGPKLKEGDLQSPEGFYTVSPTALNPWSDFHLSFNLGYPNEFDRLHKRTGGALMVHGKCASVGCFAMNDFRIEEIYTLVDAAMSGGQEQFAVHIFPFHMTWDKMAQNAKSPWIPFWENLKQGYDYFQGHRNPPMVTVEEKRYAFHTFRPLLFGSDLTAPAQPEKKEYASVVTVAKKEDVSIAKREEIKVVKKENTKVVRKEYAKIDKKAVKNRKTL
jgi:murein L,D-transpeptidase YafK